MRTTDEIAGWIFDTYEWMLAHLGGYQTFYDTPLVLPTDEFFPVPSELQGVDLAAEVFSLVRRHAGLEHWRCRLEVQDDPDISTLLSGIPHPALPKEGTAGTFQYVPEIGEAVITYYPTRWRCSPSCSTSIPGRWGASSMATPGPTTSVR